MSSEKCLLYKMIPKGAGPQRDRGDERWGGFFPLPLPGIMARVLERTLPLTAAKVHCQKCRQSTSCLGLEVRGGFQGAGPAEHSLPQGHVPRAGSHPRSLS